MKVRKIMRNRPFRHFIGDGVEPASIIRVPAPGATQPVNSNPPLQKPIPIPPERKGVEPAQRIPMPRPNPTTPKGGEQGGKRK
jgi:hypothetical protein